MAEFKVLGTGRQHGRQCNAAQGHAHTSTEYVVLPYSSHIGGLTLKQVDGGGLLRSLKSLFFAFEGGYVQSQLRAHARIGQVVFLNRALGQACASSCLVLGAANSEVLQMGVCQQRRSFRWRMRRVL